MFLACYLVLSVCYLVLSVTVLTVLTTSGIKMLLARQEVIKLLRCPKTMNALLERDGKLVPAQANGIDSAGYNIVAGFPIVVDFDRSILKEEDTENVASVINRPDYQGISGVIKKILLPPSIETKANVSHLMGVLHSRDTRRVLVIGGGTPGQSMEPFYKDPDIEIVSFDIYASDTVQFVADAHDIPLPDGEFDLVIIQAILEHVLYPEKVVSEIHRLLRDDSIVYAETPFLQNVHEGAYDFTRYTESGHRFLFRQFRMIRSGITAGTGTQLLWSIEHFVRGLFRSRAIGKAAKLGFFWLQYLDKVIPESHNIDSASGVYFMGVRQDEAIDDSEIVAYYGGAQ